MATMDVPERIIRYVREAGIQDATRQRIISLPENNEWIVWEKKSDKNRFLCARKGDSFSFPFQCEFCWCINMNKRPTSEFSMGDSLTLSFVHRVNLDMFWSKEPSTVSGTLSCYGRNRQNCNAVGIEPIVVPQGPYPISDD